MEFKALDGVIKTTNQKNDKVSTSHKCTELDKQVPEMLGVSAAIMDNVIFCHQVRFQLSDSCYGMESRSVRQYQKPLFLLFDEIQFFSQ